MYSMFRDAWRKVKSQMDGTYRLEYTPGIFASEMVSGSGESQRSGFHSYASSPQRALEVFEEITPTMTVVSLGRGISVIIFPSRPRTGSERGRTTSS